MSSNEQSYVINDIIVSEDHDETIMLQKILSVSYGLILTSYKLFGGYDDVNYHVTVTGDQHTEARIGHVLANGYVLRIFNAKDSAQPQRMEATNAMMNHAIQKGILTQSTLLNRQGHSVSLWKFISQDKEEIRVVCLRTFLPGQPFNDYKWTADMFSKFGVFVANVTRTMKDFQHTFFDSFNFSWSVENIKHLKTVLHFVKDNRRRQVVKNIVDHLSTELIEKTTDFETGIIHGDIGVTNLIFQNVEDFSGDFSTWGLIDFHDVHRSFSLCELANAVCGVYNVPKTEGMDALDAARHIVNGYRKVIPLGFREVELLVVLIKARLCNVVVHGCKQCAMEPENVTYIGKSLYPAWHLLDDIHGKPPRNIVESLLNKDQNNSVIT